MLKIEYLKTGGLVPYARNPRNNQNAVDAVAASIREFGFRSPIIIDKDKVVVAGHTRLLAAKKLGLEEVPCVVADDLTPEQIKAYRIADNRLAEIAEWDMDMLPLELKDLQTADFDLSLLGFDTEELEGLLSSGEAETAGETDADAVPETPETAVSEIGKTYALGRHRLMCGDATKADDVAELMDGKTADLWLTDPPYNVAYENSLGQSIANDDMEDGKFRQFLDDAFKCAVGVLAPGGSYYIFHADTEGYNFRGACRDAGLKVRECLIWVKNALVLGRCDYHFRHEPCLYGWKDGAPHNWYSDRCQTTVMEFHKPTANTGHPTSKPAEMLAYLVKNSSKTGETVLDTFGGSGSTLIACERTGRVCRMMELDPKYCDVIRRRWAEFVHGEGCDWAALTPEVAESSREGAETHPGTEGQ